MARIQRNTLPPAQATAERLHKACTVLLAQQTGLLSYLCSEPVQKYAKMQVSCTGCLQQSFSSRRSRRAHRCD